NLGNVMLDLETLGNKSNSAIVSLAAVAFDIETGETGRESYERIDLQSCLDAGLTVDGSTIIWWLSQSEEARKKLTENEGKNIAEVLHLFRLFCQDVGSFYIWGNGTRFDCGLLEDAYRKL